MTELEKRAKAIAWLRARGRYIAENGRGVSWNPSKVDVRQTVQNELARIARQDTSRRLRSVD